MGNVSHLTGIAIAKQQKIPQRVILFKSNYDALINLVGDHGVNFVVERPSILRDFQARAPGLNLVGMSCPERHPLIPTVPTLAEQGFVLPSVFNIVMAHSSMTIERRREIARLFYAKNREKVKAKVRAYKKRTRSQRLKQYAIEKAKPECDRRITRPRKSTIEKFYREVKIEVFKWKSKQAFNDERHDRWDTALCS